MKQTKLSLSILVLALGLSATTAVQAADSTAKIPVAQSQQALPSLAPVVKQASPAIVSITTQDTIPDATLSEQINSVFANFSNEVNAFMGSNFVPSSFFTETTSGNLTSSGSGVIIDAKEGYILTYAGLVNGANTITVTLSNNQKESATVVGIDYNSGIAVLKLKNPSSLTALPFANSSKLSAGDYTIAMQNNTGIGLTSKLGIISAVHNKQLTQQGLGNLIITNATTGNLGGFLLNTQGQLLGLIIPGVTLNGDLGVALPSNTLSNLTAQIIQYGHVERGSLGVQGVTMDANIAKAVGSNQTSGAFISQVSANSAAAKAGIKAGDIIVAVNNQKISDFPALQTAIQTSPVGTPFQIKLIRNNKTITENVTLTDNIGAKHTSSLSHYFSGVELKDTKDNKGVEIASITEGSFAQLFGLKKGDIITNINNTPINDLKDLSKVNINNVLAMKVTRGNASIYLVAQ